MARFIISAFADEAAPRLENQLAALKKNDIGFIEPRSIDGTGILELSLAELKSAKRQFDENGIRVGSLGSPIGKYPIEDDFAPHFEKFKKALDACEIFDTRLMRMFSFFIPRGEYAKYREAVLERLARMADEAERRGITLCHENEARIYGEHPAAVVDLLKNEPRLCSVFDPANYILGGDEPNRALAATLERFKYMHVKDALFADGSIVPAGEGDGRIGEALDIIDGHATGDVYLTVEPHLHVFDAYAGIDERELKGKRYFASNAEAFDFAVNALTSLLGARGYKKGDDNAWTK